MKFLFFVAMQWINYILDLIERFQKRNAQAGGLKLSEAAAAKFNIEIIINLNLGNMKLKSKLKKWQSLVLKFISQITKIKKL